ncbi:MAG: class I SAM-dependent methyltransferase [Candidatus Terrybacteria bacterium]|nr:class I SAM-dependent methyltransferase [Candidatus Terrybacteria bacterium]
MRDHRALNLAAYEEGAEEYMGASREYWKRTPKARRTLERFLASLSPASRILDLGSGGGRDAAIFRSLGHDPLCLDFSPAMIRIAHSEGLQGIVMDIEHLGFRAESFDAVWAYASLLHIPSASLPSVLREIAKILKPHGSFLLSVVRGEGEEIRDSARLKAKRYFALWSPQRLRAELRTAGFATLWYQYPQGNFIDILCRKH